MRAAGQRPRLPAGQAPIPTEHQEQAVVVEWWDINCRRFRKPRFALYAIANAGAGAQRGQAGKLKAEGVRPGVPDIFLAVMRHNQPGLYIEMKRREGGRLSAVQVEVAEYLRLEGYVVRTCFGAQEAIDAIEHYLE